MQHQGGAFLELCNVLALLKLGVLQVLEVVERYLRSAACALPGLVDLEFSADVSRV